MTVELAGSSAGAERGCRSIQYDGEVRVGAKAEPARFNATFAARVAYDVERLGDMVRITGKRDGLFAGNCGVSFSVELPVAMLRDLPGPDATFGQGRRKRWPVCEDSIHHRPSGISGRAMVIA